ncbi:MAG TPA: DNA polymerase III subunit delta' [Pirellulaceae bacterium]|jgi:DNA polymerase-3 subunit delta'|nr:DNA polymerase III subunit delta' [Pirellulaceae bacterium]
MTWSDIKGHDEIVRRFRRAIVRNRLASTFLFVGPTGIGKMKFARELAKALLCEQHHETELLACDSCPACRQVAAESHPDLEVVSKPADKSVIPIDLLIGDADHRRREGLCHNISLKPFRGGRRIAIINDADCLNQEGANCLLKTLEEPPARSVIILISASEQKQLPTIRSRCQVVRFRPLAHEIIAELLAAEEGVESPADAQRLAQLSEGSVARALDYSDAAAWEFRQTLIAHLSKSDWSSQQLVGAITAYVEEAGKDATARRERLVSVVNQTANYFRHVLREATAMDIASIGDSSASPTEWTGDARLAAECVDRCLVAEGHVHANANQATLIECWIDDLATLTRT